MKLNRISVKKHQIVFLYFVLGNCGLNLASAVAGAAASAQGASQSASTGSVNFTDPTPPAKSLSEFGLGVAGTFVTRSITSQQSETVVSPEVFGYYGYTILPTLQWASGLRFTYLSPTEIKYRVHGVNIQESSIRLIAETGLRWKWTSFLIPSLSVGTGVVLRTSDVQVLEPFAPVSGSLPGTSVSPLVQAQFGLGVLLTRGFSVGPFFRYTQIFSDPQGSSFTGIEATIALF